MWCKYVCECVYEYVREVGQYDTGGFEDKVGFQNLFAGRIT